MDINSNLYLLKRGFRLPPRRRWELSSCGLLRSK